jgi:hypothetical protein
MIKVFVGWDRRENIAWEVCRHSILARTDPEQVSVEPIIQAEMRDRGLYTRPTDLKASTEFSLTRFLTPTLAGPHGFAIFVDCDFLFLDDIRAVFEDIDPTKAVSVVKHDYQPTETVKMDGCRQHQYPRKNWSSLIVFQCNHPSVQALTPEVVNTAEPSYLHQFQWLKDDEIGSLHIGWNYLAGWYPAKYDRLKAIHYTSGGPWFDHCKDCDFAQAWLTERDNMMGVR